MRRISVVGNSGSGKTSVSRAMANRLSLSHLELDSVHHQPDWRFRPDEEMREIVARFVAGDGWVVDGNYTSNGVAGIVWARADTLVWLDLPRLLVTSRVVRRSLRRVLIGEELWSGNRERWGRWIGDRRRTSSSGLGPGTVITGRNTGQCPRMGPGSISM
ncbi:MAG: hypothetical protein ACRDX9_07275 [Acidimicrobiia bacterium]